MNSRERVRTALDHREPDRVPIDLGGMASTGISALAYHALKKHLGLESGEIRVFDIAQMLALVEEPVLRRLGADVLPLPHHDAGWGWDIWNYEGWKSWRLDGWPEFKAPRSLVTETGESGNIYVLNGKGKRVAVKPPDGYYFDPLPEKAGILPAPDELEVTDCLSERELRYYESTARELFRNTDYAILGPPLGAGLFGLNFGGLENWLCALVEQPRRVGELLDRVVEGNIKVIAQFSEAAGQYVESIVFADDLGTQHAQWISEDLFREVFAPRYSRVFNWIHEHTRLRVFFHCCGSIPGLIEPLIECGVDILNPVQTSAAGMDPQWLKSKFGDRLTFWGGGVDTQHGLLFSSLEELVADVRRRVNIFAPGGGYIFNQIHNIQPGSDPARILACYDAALAAGGYN
jgi:uroporphyrinogen decarboxylase